MTDKLNAACRNLRIIRRMVKDGSRKDIMIARAQSRIDTLIELSPDLDDYECCWFINERNGANESTDKRPESLGNSSL